MALLKPRPVPVEGGIYNPELLLVNWTGTSFVLLTVSLLFYHMTRQKSLEMPRRTAGMFAASLVVLALIYAIQALVTYIGRIERMRSRKNRAVIRQELRISRLYILLGVVLVVVECGIALTILRGSFR